MMASSHAGRKVEKNMWWRRLRLDIRVFAHLFPWRIAALFVFAFLLTAHIFQRAYINTYQVDALNFSYSKALYAIINMATFQIAYSDIPPGPELDSFFVLVPLISLPLLLMFGANLIHIIRVFFVRQERGQMWQQTLAKITPNPLVICGLGRVGYRIATQLHTEGYPVIGVEAVRTPLVDMLIDQDMPVILGDIRNIEVLRNASIPRAKQIIVCTHNDLTNIMATNHIREMNPNAELILRLFDDEIADEIKSTFQVKTTISRSAVAAQAFAYAALGLEVLETFYLEDKVYALAEVQINETCRKNYTVDAYTQDTALTAVCLYHNGLFIVEPPATTVLHENDTLIVFTELKNLTQLKNRNNENLSHIIVCGIGHTGFRIANTLIDLGQKVYAIDFEPNDLSERLKERGVELRYGDYRKNQVLISAGIKQASALITCAESDMLNVGTIIRAVDIAPSTRIIARIFEETLGHRLQQAFNIKAVYSTSEIAAPEFISAAVNLHLTQPVNLGNDDYYIARLVINERSPIKNETIRKLNQLADTTVLLHCTGNIIHIPPHEDAKVYSQDEIVILTSRNRLSQFSSA